MAGLFLLFGAFTLFADGTWETIKSFAAPSPATNGLTYDGRYLWHAYNGYPGYLYKINPDNGVVLASFETGIRDPGDIAWLNGFIYVVEENKYDTRVNRIYKADPQAQTVVDSIIIAAPEGLDTTDCQLEAITSDGRFLWVDMCGRYLLQIDPVSKLITHWYEKGWEGYADGMGFAWGSLFIVVNQGPAIVEVDPCSGRELARFRAPAGSDLGPEGLAFDGEYLWYADNTTDRIYKIRLIDDYLTKGRSLAKAAVSCGSDVSNLPVQSPPPSGLLAWPNPARPGTMLNLLLPYSARPDHIRLFDLQGRSWNVERPPPSTGPCLFIPPLTPTGWYLLRVQAGRWSESAAIIIRK